MEHHIQLRKNENQTDIHILVFFGINCCSKKLKKTYQKFKASGLEDDYLNFSELHRTVMMLIQIYCQSYGEHIKEDINHKPANF